MLDLESTFLSLNQLTGTIPSELGRLVKLREFDVTANPIHGNIPDSFSNLKKYLRKYS